MFDSNNRDDDLGPSLMMDSLLRITVLAPLLNFVLGCGTHGALAEPCTIRPEPVQTVVVLGFNLGIDRMSRTWDGVSKFDSQVQFARAVAAALPASTIGGGLAIPELLDTRRVSSSCARITLRQPFTEGGFHEFVTFVAGFTNNTLVTFGCCGPGKPLPLAVPTMNDRRYRYVLAQMMLSARFCDGRDGLEPDLPLLRGPRFDVALVAADEVSLFDSQPRTAIERFANSGGLANSEGPDPWYETRFPSVFVRHLRSRIEENMRCNYVLASGNAQTVDEVMQDDAGSLRRIVRDESNGWAIDVDGNLVLRGSACRSAVSSRASVVVRPRSCPRTGW